MSEEETMLLTASDQTLRYEPWTPDSVDSSSCPSRFQAPPAPRRATDLNGVALPPACFKGEGGHHVFVIGDWGGIWQVESMPPIPADHRSKAFHSHHRPFVMGADNCAQQNVATQMKLRAPWSDPDYVINVGDNFYWGGINVKCGAPLDRVSDVTGQWRRVFEDMYTGKGLDGKQWLGVLGNHDFGGYVFTNGWDQAIAYTWAEGDSTTGRWMTPALYWSQQVHYPGFVVDYFFVDSNVFDAFAPHVNQAHNICSVDHNPESASCGVAGPVSVHECPRWFKRLWDAQMQWLEAGLSISRATWQIVVTHFPPDHGQQDWTRMAQQFGMDLLITGHRHQQEVHYLEPGNFLQPTAFIVAGGGGGITSEGTPDRHGNDDQYGFMDLTLTSNEIMIEAISHGGAMRSRTCIVPRPSGSAVIQPAHPSLCDGLPKGPLPAPDDGSDIPGSQDQDPGGQDQNLGGQDQYSGEADERFV